MIVSIQQSCYMPWLGAFDRINKSDWHVVLDHVTASKDGSEAKNVIRTASGSQTLIVPIRNKGSCIPIRDIEIADDRHWRNKHLKAIQQNYARAPFYKKHIGFFEYLYGTDQPFLISYNLEIMEYLLEQFNINTPISFSSNMDIHGTKSQLNLEICQKLSATEYLAGPFSREYLDHKIFDNDNIKVIYHDYVCPEYKQAWPGFEKNMSAIDWLFNNEGFPP